MEPVRRSRHHRRTPRSHPVTWLWGAVLVAAVFAAHWGAEQLANPLKKLRRRWGFTAAAGGALVGLASASPDIGINTASAITGSADIGLGNMLGSNVVSVPGMVAVAYLATRKCRLGGKDGTARDTSSGGGDHRQHVDEQVLALDRQAVTVQALPYLAIVSLAAVLILWPPLRGLQPIDGAIMAVAYLCYLAQAFLRDRSSGDAVEWRTNEVALAAGGLAVLAVSSYFITTSTERLAAAAGLSNVVAGLFLTATMTAVPAWFATWAVARSGEVVSAATTTLADNTVAITVGFVPLALVGVPITDPLLVTVTFVFVALMPALYAALVHLRRDQAFGRRQVVILLVAYAAYVASAVAVFVVTDGS